MIEGLEHFDICIIKIWHSLIWCFNVSQENYVMSVLIKCDIYIRIYLREANPMTSRYILLLQK